ncbi:hypothetical protein CQ018_14095 [Arthrobacter sp. MYb227]|uniref:VanZ family protein n=1 Tax=Arthrobacter sp. MYb227 TaxID=1848601 RepID=UPI000CFA938D|nr:VanZ family protein [Arthrobacter sp. MYb227]PQZ91092.1 hypothetical protein CQ018_14095 [Arthrobacter sp. MYb227]
MRKTFFSRTWIGVLILGYLLLVFFVVFFIKINDLHLPEVISTALKSMQKYGFSDRVRFGHIEAAANILFFIPLGALLPLWFKTRQWVTALFTCFAISVAVESVQFIILSNRVGSIRDVICNSIGAGFGVLLTWIVIEIRVRKVTNAPVQYPR